MYWNNQTMHSFRSPWLVFQVEWIVLALDSMFHLDDAFVGIIGIQHSVIFSG